MAINAAWKAAAMHDLEFSNMSYEELGRKYGRSPSSILKLKRNSKIVRPSNLQTGNKSVANMDVIDEAHRNIGVHLAIFRGTRSASFLAELLGISPHRLRKLELGLSEITLVELIRASKVLNKSIAQLMTPYEAGDD